MAKESLVMPVLRQLNIPFSYNFDQLDGFVINCVLFKKICKIRENATGIIMVEFPLDEVEHKRFDNIKKFMYYLGNGEIQ
jgi:hypothetical protein